MKKTIDFEKLRCLRHGDMRRLFEYRYGHALPDDDAGNGDLWPFICNASLAEKEPEKKMKALLEIWAPWMSADKVESYVAHVLGLERYHRVMTAEELGRRLMLANANRQRLKLWQILPTDATSEELEEQRKARRRRNRKAKRRADNVKPREVYLAEMKAKPKPWTVLRMSRATYYRKVRRGVVPIIVSKEVPEVVSAPIRGQVVHLDSRPPSSSSAQVTDLVSLHGTGPEQDGSWDLPRD
jgi:hypothetical protein